MQEVYKKAQRNSIFGCLICGDLVDVKVGVKCVKCVKDHRITHDYCVRKLGLDDKHVKKYVELVKHSYKPM